jgi:hypothetical protein
VPINTVQIPLALALALAPKSLALAPKSLALAPKSLALLSNVNAAYALLQFKVNDTWKQYLWTTLPLLEFLSPVVHRRE